MAHCPTQLNKKIVQLPDTSRKKPALILTPAPATKKCYRFKTDLADIAGETNENAQLTQD
jgi:hypothetical protein